MGTKTLFTFSKQLEILNLVQHHKDNLFYMKNKQIKIKDFYYL